LADCKQEAVELIDQYFTKALLSTKLLYENQLYGQMLIVILSTIDSYGFLDAAPKVQKATGKSFKDWVKKYFLQNPRLEYDENALWAARCSILHIYTAESDLSRMNKVKKIAFYAGDKLTKQADDMIVHINKISSGSYVVANIEETYLTFINTTQLFSRDLLRKCCEDEIVYKRLSNVLRNALWDSDKGRLG
jgi:hypothetical protein